MDESNSRLSPQESAVTDGGGDWRAQLQPELRHRNINQIVDILKHFQCAYPVGTSEFKKIAEACEELHYHAASSQYDYLRRMEIKILNLKSRCATANSMGMTNLEVQMCDLQLYGHDGSSRVGRRIPAKAQMDGSNSRSSPQESAATDGGDDWRAQLQPELRHRFINQIVDILKHLQCAYLVRTSDKKIAEACEEKNYYAASSQSDYLRRMEIKILNLKTRCATVNSMGMTNLEVQMCDLQL